MSAPGAGRARRGGLLVRVDGVLRFVPATVAMRVSSAPRITVVPGAPEELVGVTLHMGAIVPVLAIGGARGDMIVCQHGGESVALVGGELVRAGLFDVSEESDGVDVDGQHAAAINLSAMFARVQARARAASRGLVGAAQ